MKEFILLLCLTVYLGIIITKTLRAHLIKREKLLQEVQKNYRRLENEHTNLLEESNKMKVTLEKTLTLYDITKQICKTLDEGKVFTLFREELQKHIRVEECVFFKKDADLSGYSDYTILPLEINRKLVGYLAASGIQKNDEEKFNILGQQFLLGIKRAILYQRVQDLAISDSLTNVLGRRHWLERFDQELERARKLKQKFSFLMVDIDHFKSVNDRYGHLVGDAILKSVSKIIKENVRQIDLVCRYGGEEFAVILAETDKDGARFAAERIRQSVEEKKLRIYDEDLNITISIGISVFPEDTHEKADLIEKADTALYHAKQTGRNKVCFFGAK